MNRSRRLGVGALSISAGLWLILGLGQQLGLRLNFTDSAPKGLWWVASRELSNLERGAWVELCPPPVPVVQRMAEQGHLAAGSCEGSGVLPLLKPISALEGDHVHLSQGLEVQLNGRALPNTCALIRLPNWPSGDYVVQPNEAWVFSSHSPNSFDSRYFGPVALTQVRGIAHPLWVWP